MHQQEKAIKFLTTHRKHRILWWGFGFGPSLLEDLCREKKFGAKEFLDKKDEKQFIELLRAFGERKVYWWWPWSEKIKDIVIGSKQYQRAREYKNYSWLWKIFLGLFTSVLVHRQILKWDSIFTSCGGYMYKNDSHGQAKDLEMPTRSLNIPGNVIDLNGKFETIEDTLNSLGLSGLLQQLDDSLEKVRRNIDNRKKHEQLVKELDKKMQKLCLQVHPDKVKNRGGSEEEIVKAQERQAALSASRTVIKNISEHFLDLIHIDYKYEFYSKMKIGLLGNTKELNRLNFKMLMELATLSRIKQEEIIGNINKFLEISNASIGSFINGYYDKSDKNTEHNFEKNRSGALHHLRICISGYEKFNNQLNEIKKECRKDEELKSLLYNPICKTFKDSDQQLKQLKEVETFAQTSLEGKFSSINIENLDEYFVLPFATYISALLICSMSKKTEKSSNLLTLVKRLWSFISSVFSSKECEKGGQHKYSKDLYNNAHILMLYLNGDSKYENKVRDILGKNETIIHEKVKTRFIKAVIEINAELAQRFKSDNYIERGSMKERTEQLCELEKRVSDLISKMQEDLKQVQDIQKGQEKIKEEQKQNKGKLEKLKKMIKSCEKQKKERTKVRSSSVEQSSNSLNEVESVSSKQLTSSGAEDSSNNRLQPILCSHLLSSSRSQQQKQACDGQVAQSVSQSNSGLNELQIILHHRSSSFSSSDDRYNQPGPSSDLSELQPMSRSQSLSSLHSNDSDVEIISKSQCR